MEPIYQVFTYGIRRHSWVTNRLFVVTSPHVHLANIWAKSSNLTPASNLYNKRRKSPSPRSDTSWEWPADKDVWHMWNGFFLVVETIPHSQRTNKLEKSFANKPGRCAECNRYSRAGVVASIGGEGGKNRVANRRASKCMSILELFSLLNFSHTRILVPFFFSTHRQMICQVLSLRNISRRIERLRKKLVGGG